MRRFVLAILAVPALALAAEQKASAPPDDPMAGWKPRKVTNEAQDKKEIAALFRAMDEAGKKGDLDAAAALVDFPVLMVTDDSKGQAMGDAWTREQWIEVMKPFYAKPMADLKVTHKPNVFLVSDSLASVDDVYTMTMGKKTMTGRTNTLLVRRDGKWKMKSMVESGWGDMMAQGAPQGGAAPPQGGAQGTSTGTTR